MAHHRIIIVHPAKSLEYDGSADNTDIDAIVTSLQNVGASASLIQAMQYIQGAASSATPATDPQYVYENADLNRQWQGSATSLPAIISALQNTDPTGYAALITGLQGIQ